MRLQNLKNPAADFGCEHSVHRLFCSALCFKSSKLTIDFIDSRVCHGWGGLTEPYLKKIGARNLTFPFLWAMCVFMLYSDCFYRKGWKGLIDLDLDILMDVPITGSGHQHRLSQVGLGLFIYVLTLLRLHSFKYMM